AHIRRRPERLSALAPVAASVEAVVLRCLAKDRDERFSDAGELAAAFERALRAADAPKAAPAPAAAPLLFFRSQRDAGTVARVLARLGARLVHAQAPRFAAWAGDASHASSVAQDLIGEGVCAHARIDLVPLTVRDGRDGAPRMMSPAFAEPARWAE